MQRYTTNAPPAAAPYPPSDAPPGAPPYPAYPPPPHDARRCAPFFIFNQLANISPQQPIHLMSTHKVFLSRPLPPPQTPLSHHKPLNLPQSSRKQSKHPPHRLDQRGSGNCKVLLQILNSSSLLHPNHTSFHRHHRMRIMKHTTVNHILPWTAKETPSPLLPPVMVLPSLRLLDPALVRGVVS